jgi:hypothetical protein
MLKQNGIIERELCTVRIAKNGGLLRNMFVTEDGGVLNAHMYVTVEEELRDWEYQAVYDHYDIEVYDGLGLTVTEAPGDDNPVWEVVFPYLEDAEKLAAKAEGILNLHKRELEGVLEAVKDAEGDYNDV